VLVFAALPGLAQDANHWGLEADSGVGFVPNSLFQSLQNRYKASGSLSGYDYSVGLVRFHANGAPWNFPEPTLRREPHGLKIVRYLQREHEFQRLHGHQVRQLHSPAALQHR